LKATTISVGVTELRQRGSSMEMINEADQALFKAKDKGRNCVTTKE
jgi:PleD family two-component response regulator